MRVLLLLALASVLLPLASAETRNIPYGPALGLGTELHGASVNWRPVAVRSAENATSVNVKVVDNDSKNVYFAFCQDVNRNGRCSELHGDLDMHAFNTLSWTPPGGIAAGTQFDVYVYTAYADTTQTARATFGYVSITFT